MNCGFNMKKLKFENYTDYEIKTMWNSHAKMLQKGILQISILLLTFLRMLLSRSFGKPVILKEGYVFQMNANKQFNNINRKRH